MMMYNRILLLILVIVWCSSCDPMRRINMHNNTGGEATITWKIKEDSLHSSPFFITSDQEQTFHFDQDARPILMSAGIGTWTPKQLRNLVDDLESVTIKWDKGEIRLDSEDEIFKFLLPRRRGVGKDKINIHISDLAYR